MQELQKLHRNYSSGAIIWGSVHPTEENILLLKNIAMYNYTPVSWVRQKTVFQTRSWKELPTKIACISMYGLL